MVFITVRNPDNKRSRCTKFPAYPIPGCVVKSSEEDQLPNTFPSVFLQDQIKKSTSASTPCVKVQPPPSEDLSPKGESLKRNFHHNKPNFKGTESFEDATQNSIKYLYKPPAGTKVLNCSTAVINEEEMKRIKNNTEFPFEPFFRKRSSGHLNFEDSKLIKFEDIIEESNESLNFSQNSLPNNNNREAEVRKETRNEQTYTSGNFTVQLKDSIAKLRKLSFSDIIENVISDSIQVFSTDEEEEDGNEEEEKKVKEEEIRVENKGSSNPQPKTVTHPAVDSQSNNKRAKDSNEVEFKDNIKDIDKTDKRDNKSNEIKKSGGFFANFGKTMLLGCQDILNAFGINENYKEDIFTFNDYRVVIKGCGSIIKGVFMNGHNKQNSSASMQIALQVIGLECNSVAEDFVSNITVEGNVWKLVLERNRGQIEIQVKDGKSPMDIRFFVPEEDMLNIEVP